MKGKKELARILDKLASIAFELATLLKTASETPKAKALMRKKNHELNLYWRKYEEKVRGIIKED